MGYGRKAYGACSNTTGSTYLCSGNETTTQTINANNADVDTTAGFSVNTTTGNGITITGDGALSFTDTNSSTITSGDADGLNVMQVMTMVRQKALSPSPLMVALPVH